MSSPYLHVITDPAAWKAAQVTQSDAWTHRLSDDDVQELDAALRAVRDRELDLPRIGKDVFRLPGLGRKLQAWSREIESGKGFVLLQGFPAQEYAVEDVETVFWGIGTYLGVPVTQNPKGELLGHVKDYGRQFGNLDVRGYETNAKLQFHTDGCDLVGLMCLRRAKSGGLSSIVSALTVHNEMLRRYPEYLPSLYRGFYYIKREAAMSESPVTSVRVPVFGQVNGVVSCRYVRAQIDAACTKTGKELSSLEREALDCLDALAAEPELRLSMDLQPGDMQLCNNYTILHARTDFEDWPEVERRRHMLRLWLSCHERRPLAPDFPQHNGYGLGQIAEVAFSH